MLHFILTWLKQQRMHGYYAAMSGVKQLNFSFLLNTQKYIFLYHNSAVSSANPEASTYRRTL